MPAGAEASATSGCARRAAAIARGTRAIAISGVGLLFAAAAISVVEILSRWLLRASILGISDIFAVATALGVCCCFPHCATVRGHIAIQMLDDAKLGRTLALLVDVLGRILAIVVFAGLAFQLWRFGAESAAAGSASLMLKIPMGRVWQLAALPCGVAAVVEVMQLGQRLVCPHQPQALQALPAA